MLCVMQYSYNLHNTWIKTILICVLYILNQYSASNYEEMCISYHLWIFNASPINFETLDEQWFSTRNKVVAQVRLRLGQ